LKNSKSPADVGVDTHIGQRIQHVVSMPIYLVF